MGTLLRETDPEGLPIMRKFMLNMDPPRHRQYRALINKAFTPRMVDGLRPRIATLVREIVDAVIEKGECDFVEELAAPLPMLVICEMMGVPVETAAASTSCRLMVASVTRAQPGSKPAPV
jgi:cholest-4-en-3-one 26-monooxygenase